MESFLSHFNWIDGVILFFVLWGVFWGVKRGLTGEILKIIGVLVAFVLAIRYSALWGGYINEQQWADQEIVNWIAFFLIFLLVALGFFLLAKIPYLILRKTLLGTVDRILGGVFGAIRGLVIISVVLTCIVIVVGGKASQIVEEESFAGRRLVDVTYWAWEKLYEHKDVVLDKVQENIEEIHNETEGDISKSD